MHAFVRRGLTAVALLLFSANIYADVADCDVKLKPFKELRPLYGLCVAYWSAGENERLPLQELYLAKVLKLLERGVDVPPELSDLPFDEVDPNAVCPCWDIEEVVRVLACGDYAKISFPDYDSNGFNADTNTHYASFFGFGPGTETLYFPGFIVGPTSNGVECEVEDSLEAGILTEPEVLSSGEESACRADIVRLNASLSCD